MIADSREQRAVDFTESRRNFDAGRVQFSVPAKCAVVLPPYTGWPRGGDPPAHIAHFCRSAGIPAGGLTRHIDGYFTPPGGRKRKRKFRWFVVRLPRPADVAILKLAFADWIV